MSANSEKQKTPSPEEIALVFSYLQKFLVDYVKQNNTTQIKETIPVDDQEDEGENESPNEKDQESKNQDVNPSTYRNYNGYRRSYYGNNGYRRSYYGGNNGYRRSYYNGKYSYNGIPRKQGYRRDNNVYNGVPGQEDPESQ